MISRKSRSLVRENDFSSKTQQYRQFQEVETEHN